MIDRAGDSFQNPSLYRFTVKNLRLPGGSLFQRLIKSCSSCHKFALPSAEFGKAFLRRFQRQPAVYAILDEFCEAFQIIVEYH